LRRERAALRRTFQLTTALTLGVVPVLYSLFFKVSYKDFVV